MAKTKARREDGTPYETAGAKEGNGGPSDKWVGQTEELVSIPEHEDDDLASLAGPGAESGEAMTEHGDDEEMLLDESETIDYPHGGVFPTGDTPPVGGSTIGAHGAISDPEPDVSGGGTISVEGESTNDEEEEEEKDDDDSDGDHDDDVEMAY